jgi:hypothetical protein
MATLTPVLCWRVSSTANDTVKARAMKVNKGLEFPTMGEVEQEAMRISYAITTWAMQSLVT